MIYEVKNSQEVSLLFEGWNETLIWSCLENIMGHLYTNDLNHPVSAMAMLGDFCFLAGIPNKTLIRYKPPYCKQNFIIMIPQNEAWAKLIEECYPKKAKSVIRYAIKKEPDLFDQLTLQKIIDGLPKEYTLQMINEKLFLHCKNNAWCHDLVSQYPDYKMYNTYGLGAMILKDGKPISGASSYSRYSKGIEIEINTKEEYRRKGLAYICAAKLILECLKRELYPSWDAQNKWSLALAEKLGYHFDHAYSAYEIYEY